jgi:hypothetical protein
VIGSDGTDVTYLDRRTVRLGSDQSTSSTSYQDATGLSFSVEANANYHFGFFVLFQASGTSVGIDLAINGPASPTKIMYHVYLYDGTTTNVFTQFYRAYDSGQALTGVDTANTDVPGWIWGNLSNGANSGTLIVRFKGPGLGTVRVMTGSSGWIQKL